MDSSYEIVSLCLATPQLYSFCKFFCLMFLKKQQSHLVFTNKFPLNRIYSDIQMKLIRIWIIHLVQSIDLKS